MGGGPLWIGDEDDVRWGRPDFRLGVEIKPDGSPIFVVAPVKENGDVNMDTDAIAVSPETFRCLVALKQSAELSCIRDTLQESLSREDVGDNVLSVLRRIADRE